MQKGVMEFIIELLMEEQPLLLLFIVIALGYALGGIKIKGTGLGVAAVLFVGLFFGALDERLTLPPVMVTLGLVLFVYSVGLASGPGFFASFSRNGLRDNLLVAGTLLVATLIVVIEHFFLGFKPLNQRRHLYGRADRRALAGAGRRLHRHQRARRHCQSGCR